MSSADNAHQIVIDECVALANAAYSRGQLVEATTRYVQARMLCKQAGITDSVELRHCLKTLGEIYTKRHKPEEGLEIILALRELDDSVENRRAYVTLLYQIANSYEKQGERESAEKAYGDALIEATELLPARDPLIDLLNLAGIEIFKKTFKSQKLTTADTQVILANLPTDQPVIEEKTATASQIDLPRIPEGSARTAHKNSFKSFLQFSLRAVQGMLHSSVLSIVLSLILVSALVKAALYVPSMRTEEKEITVVSKIEGQNFESCDKKTSFSIIDTKQCSIKRPKFNGQCHYTIVENNLNDLASMLRGYLTRDEFWYHVSKGAIIDPDKTVLYRGNAPELAVAKKMWWYADFAQKWFRQKHVYPRDAEQCKNSDKQFQYQNPFSLSQESAAIVSLKGVPVDKTWSVRPQDGLAAPHWKPGAIFCVCQDGKRFLIHGCDRNGTPLTASDPLHYFVIECFDGANVTTANMLKDDDGVQSELRSRPLRVFVCAKPEQEATIRYFRSCSCALVWIWAILAGLWCISNHRLKQSFTLKAISMSVTVLAFCAVAAWYLVAFAHD